ncbi:MAG: polysaccharide biosynthesis C-terminal domain-containing protein [Bacteroidota bacterium]
MEKTKISRERRILSGTAVSLGAQIIGYVLYLFAIRAILGGLSKEENGVLFGIQRLCDLVLALAVEAGMNTVVLRKIIQNEEDYDAIMATFAKLRFLLWLGATALIVGIGLIFMPGNLSLLMVWSLYMLIGSKSALWRFVFELRYRAKTNLLPVYLLGLLDTVLFLVIIYFAPTPLTAMHIVSGFCISAIPGIVILMIMSGDWKVFSVPFSKPIAKDIFKSSFPVMLAFVLMQIHDKSDAFFLGYFTNATELGKFGAVYRILPPLLAVAITITTVFTPSIAKFQVSDPERCKRYIFGGLKILLYFGGLISVMLSASTGLIIEALTKGVYADSYIQFFAFMWLPIPVYIIIFLFDINIVLGLQRNNFIITAVEAGLSIITNILLTPFFASVGTVFSKLSTLIISAAVAVWLLKSVLKDYNVLGFFTRYSAAAIGGLFCAVFLPNVMPEIAASCLGGVVYMGLLFLLKAIDTDDVVLLRQYLQKVYL